MELKAVQSSNLKATGHDPEKNLMVVEFQGQKMKDGSTKPGGIYLYPEVTAAQHEALVTAPSIGSHFDTHFVKTKHPFTRLR